MEYNRDMKQIKENWQTLTFLTLYTSFIFGGFGYMLSPLEKRMDRMDMRFEKRMDRIDTRMNQMDTRIDQIDTRINHIDTRINHIESDIKNIESDLKEIKSLILANNKKTASIPKNK